MVPARTGDQVRIGVAIAVPEPYAGELRLARATVGDPLAEYVPPHITLLGPTVIEPDRLPEVREHLAGVAAAHRPFVIRLRGTGSFRPVSDVVFVQVGEGIAECEQIEAAVRCGPLAQELRFHYHPHVTVAHDLPAEALDRAFLTLGDYRADFVVSQLTLFEHAADEEDAGAWRPVVDFRLTGLHRAP